MINEDQMTTENGNENNESPKGHIIMVIFCILVVILFFKFVLPAMEKGDKPPSSILTGEVVK